MLGRAVESKTVKKHMFFKSDLKADFSPQVGPRDQTSDVWGPQNVRKSVLWSDKSGRDILEPRVPGNDIVFDY